MDEYDEAFKVGVELFEVGLYWESIDHFKDMESIYSNHSSLDDLHINIGVCYMMLGLYEEAETYFLPVYREEIGDGEFQPGGNNFGRTRSRAILGLIRISIARGQSFQTDEYFAEISRDERSGLKDGKTDILFRDIAEAEIKLSKNR